MQTQAISANSLGKTEAKERGGKNYLRAIGRFFGFDFLYASFLMVFFFKYTEIFRPIQREIDLTAALFVLLILGWGAIIVQKGYKKNTFSPLLLPPLFLLGWLLFTLLYSIDFRYGWFITFYYLPTTAAAFLVGYFVIAPDDRRVRNLFLWMVIFACFLSYLNIESYYLDRGLAKYWISADFDNWSSYIDRSLVIVSAATIIISSLFALFARRLPFSYIDLKLFKIRDMYVFVLLLALFLLGVLHGGSRQGFVLFLTMPLLAYLLFYISKHHSRRLYFSFMLLLISSGIFFFFYYFLGDVFQTSVYRRTIDDIEYHGFSPTRVKLWTFSWMLIQERTLAGVGFGGFREAIGNYGLYTYPHNLFLEIWIELGLLGLLILFVWIVLFCKGGLTVLRERRDSLFIPTLLLALLWFLSLQVSGSWVESRFSAAFAGIFAGRIAIASFRNRPANSRNRALKSADGRGLPAVEGRLNGRQVGFYSREGA